MTLASRLGNRRNILFLIAFALLSARMALGTATAQVPWIYFYFYGAVSSSSTQSLPVSTSSSSFSTVRSSSSYSRSSYVSSFWSSSLSTSRYSSSSFSSSWSSSSWSAVCGDSIVTTSIGEECDNGKSCDNPGAPLTNCMKDSDCGLFVSCKPMNGDGCNANCKMEFCGDGVVQPNSIWGEQCDNGGHCASDPQLSCTTHTTCRDISGSDSDSCVHDDSPSCIQCVSDICGDGRTQPGSLKCDDGKHCVNGSSCKDAGDCIQSNPQDSSCVPRSGDGCSASCEYEFCGNGKVDSGAKCPNGSYCTPGATCPGGSLCKAKEECDPGAGFVTASCDSDCTYAKCGDNVVNPAAGEECDDGKHCANGNTCTANADCIDGSTCRARGAFGNPGCNDVCQAQTPLKCCTCYYENPASCSGEAQATCGVFECEDGDDNDGDLLKDGLDPDCQSTFGDPDDSESLPGIQRDDCRWSEGACVSRFLLYCKNDFINNGCQNTRTFPKPQSAVPYPSLPVCTSTQDFTEGHSGPSQCTIYTNFVKSCVSCNTASCQQYAVQGCSTFADPAAGYAAAQSIQQTLQLHGISTVIITGNQMLSSPSCMSITTYTITETGITTTYGPCNFGGMCFQAGQTYTCDDGNGPVSGVCCPNPVNDPSKPYVRMSGSSCPPPQPPPPTISNGTCSGQGTAWRCSPEATSAAWMNANATCSVKQQECVSAHPSAQYGVTCDGHLVSSSWIPPQCTWEIECNWTCDW